MSLLQFLKNNPRTLGFGLFFTFFSSYGQTFFISLFVPHVADEYGFSNAGFGSVYALATLGAAFSLTYVGKFIDTVSLKRYSLFSVLFLGLSMLVLAWSFHPAIMFLGLFGTRFGGQGLMSHTAITTMSKYFVSTRGKAISLATLGHPAGEAILPILITLGISFFGWKYTLSVASLCFLVLAAVVIFLVMDFSGLKEPKSPKSSQHRIRQWDVIRSKAFWLIAPNIFLIAFLTTCLFFYQVSLAGYKGWTIEWMALCFTGFALASSSSMILSGFLIDRYSARALFPFYYFPFCAGIAFLILGGGYWVGMAYMILMGVTVGFGATIKSALQAELFELRSLGTVRSLFNTLSVLSTALGPALFGFFLDRGLSFHYLLTASLIIALLIALQSFRIYTLYRYKKIWVKIRPYLQFNWRKFS